MLKSLKTLFLLVAVSCFVLAFTGCSRDQQDEAPAKSPEKAAKQTKRQMPPSKPPEIIEVSGKVLDVLAGGNFIFVLIDRDGEQIWATVPASDVKVGETISLENATLFGKFYSKSLDRTFDSLIFASKIAGKETKRMAGVDPSQRRSGRLTAAGLPNPIDAQKSGESGNE